MRHYRIVCKHNRVISQCRCNQDKEILLGDCPTPEQHAELPVVYDGSPGKVLEWTTHPRSVALTRANWSSQANERNQRATIREQVVGSVQPITKFFKRN